MATDEQVKCSDILKQINTGEENVVSGKNGISDDTMGEGRQRVGSSLVADTHDNQNNVTFSKDYEAVLQIKQQLESKRNKPIGRKWLPRLSIDWLLPRKPREYKLLAFVTLLFFIIISGLIVVYHFHEEDLYYVYYGQNIMVNEKTLDIEVYNRHRVSVLKGRLWRTRPNGRLPYDCTYSLSNDHSGFCLLWKQLQQLHIKHFSMNNAACYNIQWKALDTTVRHMDCFQLESTVHWYGSGLSSIQLWPLERTSFNKQLFVTGTFHDRNCFGPVVERYWLSSSGVTITVAENLPLHVSINSRPVDEHGLPTSNVTDRQLCLYADNTPELNYTICVGDNVQHVHQSVAELLTDKQSYQHITWPLIRNPVWSTWSLYKNSYNESSLKKFIRKIKSLQFNEDGGLLLIDDGWEENYGDMKYDGRKFSDPKEMIKDIHSNGFQVSLWSHPQLNTDSLSFQQATVSGFLVRDKTGEVPGLTRWWNGPHSNPWSRGVAGLVDVSDNRAVQWQRDRLVKFKRQYDIDMFHLAGGETVSWSQHSTVFTRSFADPNDFTYHMAKLVSSLSTEDQLTVVQSAYRCQRLPVLVRVTQGSSSWNDIGGLHSIIPSVLSLSLIGYPFFISEAIGGSAFNGPPPKELYIRWLQLASFLPIMHFSYPPDYYDTETVAIAEKMVRLHKTLVAPTVFDLINQSAADLSPIVRPVWWLAPTEENALVTDSEFLLGNVILVAPIVEQGARHRTIYLPPGEWLYQLTNITYHGPLLIHKHHVPLDQIAFFISLSSKQTADKMLYD